MSRHRNVRKLDYADECDIDDVYGRSVEEDFCISPTTAAEYMYDRGAQSRNISSFFDERPDIPEESEESEELLTSVEDLQLNQENQARLHSCLDYLRDVVGHDFDEQILSNAIVKNNFDSEAALKSILDDNTIKDVPKPQREQRRDRRRNTDDFSSTDHSASDDSEKEGKAESENSMDFNLAKLNVCSSNLQNSVNSGRNPKESVITQSNSAVGLGFEGGLSTYLAKNNQEKVLKLEQNDKRPFSTSFTNDKKSKENLNLVTEHKKSSLVCKNKDSEDNKESSMHSFNFNFKPYFESSKTDKTAELAQSHSSASSKLAFLAKQHKSDMKTKTEFHRSTKQTTNAEDLQERAFPAPSSRLAKFLPNQVAKIPSNNLVDNAASGRNRSVLTSNNVIKHKVYSDLAPEGGSFSTKETKRKATDVPSNSSMNDEKQNNCPNHVTKLDNADNILKSNENKTLDYIRCSSIVKRNDDLSPSLGKCSTQQQFTGLTVTSANINCVPEIFQSSNTLVDKVKDSQQVRSENPENSGRNKIKSGSRLSRLAKAHLSSESLSERFLPKKKPIAENYSCDEVQQSLSSASEIDSMHENSVRDFEIESNFARKSKENEEKIKIDEFNFSDALTCRYLNVSTHIQTQQDANVSVENRRKLHEHSEFGFESSVCVKKATPSMFGYVMSLQLKAFNAKSAGVLIPSNSFVLVSGQGNIKPFQFDTPSPDDITKELRRKKKPSVK